MNCHDFEAVAGELAGERLMDATQRENAHAHAASCTGCALRLADEQALTAGFRVVAEMTDDETPARVEAALLAAFRQNAASPAIGKVRIARPRWVYAAASVAAIALIVTLIALVASRTKLEERVPQRAINPSPAVPDEPRPTVPSQQAAVTVVVRQQRPAERARHKSRTRLQPAIPNPTPGTTEIATDFIPLMNRETLAQMDGGQVMRVELPRSALMSFGLPMDMERASERIKADVLVGNDGMARAIRFVR
jgi:hypothetical protein